MRSWMRPSGASGCPSTTGCAVICATTPATSCSTRRRSSAATSTAPTSSGCSTSTPAARPITPRASGRCSCTSCGTITSGEAPRAISRGRPERHRQGDFYMSTVIPTHELCARRRAGAPARRRARWCSGVGIDRLDMAQTLARCEDLIARREFAQHVAINAAKLVAMQHDPELRRIVERVRAGLRRRSGGGVGLAPAGRSAARARGRHRPHAGVVRARGAPRVSRVHPRRQGRRARAGPRQDHGAPSTAPARRDARRLLHRGGGRGGRRGGARRPSGHPVRRHLLAAQGVLAGALRARLSTFRS